jgi:serine protease Do
MAVMTTIDDPTASAAVRIAADVSPGVVRIGPEWGRGAGLVVAAGTVLTNAHNLTSERVVVTFGDGRVAAGEVAGLDPDADLAVVTVDTASLPAPPWADGSPGLGAVVLTVVHDAAAGTRVTTGRVSAVSAAFRGPRGRPVRDALEHTAPLARGSSGGPLLGADGRVVGINTHRRDDGFYLAVRTDAALRTRIDALVEGVAARGVRLGVAVAPAEVARRLRSAVGLPEREGLLVAGVEPDSPAAGAGLRKGDLLAALADRPLRTSDDLYAVLDDLRAGTDAPAVVARGVEELTLTVHF